MRHVGDELPFGGGDLFRLFQRNAQAVMFVDRFRDVDRKGEEPVRQAAAALDTFVDDADEARAAVQGLEVHDRMEHPLARADHFLIELPELVGRAG